MRVKHWILAASALVVLAAVAGGVASARKERPLEVRIEAVEREDLVASVRATGWIQPRRAVEIQSDVMGRITELLVEEGDRVEGGQLLLRIDPTQIEAMVARSRAAVSEALAREAQARANLLQAERALARSRALAASDSGLVSRQQIEELETQAEVQAELAAAASHGVAQSRAALREAENQLARTIIRSPIAGVISRLNVEVGEMAIVGTMNNPGSVLLTVSDLSVMEAVVRIHETDVPSIRLGDSAKVEIDAFPRRSFSGVVSRISHSAVRPPEAVRAAAGGGAGQAADFEVIVTLRNPPEGLRPDLSATADIVTATRDSVLAIPIIALTVRERRALAAPDVAEASPDAAVRPAEGDVEGVFIVRDGRAHFVPVEVGITGRAHFEVLAGLSPGDSVVAGPYDAIRALTDGRLVQPRQDTDDDRAGGS